MPEFRLTPFDMILLNTPPRFLKDETRKIRNSIISRKSYYKNWEKVNEKRRNNEELREKDRKRRKANREELNRKAREKTKKEREEDPNKFRDKEKKLREAKPEYYNKKDKKNSWKRQGLNMEHFEEIYEIYMITTHCDLCGVELTDGKIRTKTTKCMDHSHITGEFRNIVCCSCNSSLPERT